LVNDNCEDSEKQVDHGEPPSVAATFFTDPLGIYRKTKFGLFSKV
jgi:hypothetical protein